MSSADLHAAGASLRSTIDDVGRQLDTIRRHWDESLHGAGTRGDAPDAALRHAATILALTHNELLPLADAIRILHLAAELEAPLESARRFIMLAWGHTTLGQTMLLTLRAMSESLDAACAAQLAALCTAEAAPVARPFEESTELSAEEIHRRALAQAPPEVRELLATNPDATLLEVGPDTLVLALGDIDTADSVTTLVAGVGSSAPENWPRQVERLRGIHPGAGSASVLWLGYEAPSSIPAGLGGAAAQRAAPELRSFQRELAQRRPQQRRVLMGYSYGSVVAGSAAAGGKEGDRLEADALILVGSPGVPARHAQDLHVPEVYAVTGEADPIMLSAGPVTGAHGANPVGPDFGARVWPSGSAHSSYFEDPDFQRRVKEVIRGTAGAGAAGSR